MAELFTVVAWMEAKLGMETDLRTALLELIEPTRKEGGCVQYDLHEHTERPGHFVFYENWKSHDHLDRHLATPHLQAFQAVSPDLLAEPARIETYWRIA